MQQTSISPLHTKANCRQNNPSTPLPFSKPNLRSHWKPDLISSNNLYVAILKVSSLTAQQNKWDFIKLLSLHYIMWIIIITCAQSTYIYIYIYKNKKQVSWRYFRPIEKVTLRYSKAQDPEHEPSAEYVDLLLNKWSKI
jgi:hypothetical protein